MTGKERVRRAIRFEGFARPVQDFTQAFEFGRISHGHLRDQRPHRARRVLRHTGQGLRVGEDISVAGFDNIPVSRIVNPTLSTVDFATDTIAELLVEFLLKRIREPNESAPKTILFPTWLVLRDSRRIWE